MNNLDKVVYEGLTLREFLKECMKRLIIEEEGFSGKRPFGNSGWLQEIREALDIEDDQPILEAIDAL